MAQATRSSGPPDSIFASSSRPRGLYGKYIEGCFIDLGDSPARGAHGDMYNQRGTGSSNPRLLPVALRVFFDPPNNTAFFRLRADVDLPNVQQQPAGKEAGAGHEERQDTSSTSPLYLDIRPEHIRNLALDREHVLHFSFTASRSMTLVAPRSRAPFDPATSPHFLVALGLLTVQSTVRVRLPAADSATATPADVRASLASLCRAINNRIDNSPAAAAAGGGGGGGEQQQDDGGALLRPDPLHTDLRSLYRGEGGRAVDVDAELLLLLTPTRQAPPPFPDASAGCDDDDDHDVAPPNYAAKDTNRPSPNPPSQGQPTAGRPDPQRLPPKRKRICSPSSQSSSDAGERAPEKHKNQEEVLSEMLQRAAREAEERLRRQTVALEELSAAVESKCAQMAAQASELRVLIAEARDVISRNSLVGGAQQQQPVTVAGAGADAQADSQADADPPGSPSQSQISTASRPSASPPSSSSSEAAAAAPPLSPRLLNHVAAQIDCLRAEIDAADYATVQHVAEELCSVRAELDDEVQDMVNEAVDSAVGHVRENIISALIE